MHHLAPDECAIWRVYGRWRVYDARGVELARADDRDGAIDRARALGYRVAWAGDQAR